MIKRLFRSPIFTIGLFVAAAVLILVGGMGTVRAAPRIQSNDWKGEVELTDIETALVENGNIVEGHDTLLGSSFRNPNNLGSNAENFQYGVTYDEALSVRNVGSIDQYVRVTVYKFWEDGDGKKDPTLDPSLIDLHFVTDGGWSIDTAASTPERTVLYYDKILGAPKGSETGNIPGSSLFADKLTIKDEVATAQGNYNGKTFRIKAVVDAVQTHNADAARVGAWGLMK